MNLVKEYLSLKILLLSHPTFQFMPFLYILSTNPFQTFTSLSRTQNLIMMVQKYLHELLQQDQEPFLLQNYIADRRRPSSSSTKQRRTLFKNACLFSFHDSPDPRKSPLFLSPTASTLAKNCSNAVLHIPARTAALLLEAAMKIHKQSDSKKPKSNKKAAAVGLIDSVLKRLGSRNRDLHSISPATVTFSVSGGNSQRTSTFWSEKSLDFDRCSSSTSTEEESQEHIPAPETELETISREDLFCSSPQTPFRFSLTANGGLSPEFSSPAASPAARRTKEVNKKQTHIEEEEQFSPVSVLEPQFEDSDNKESIESIGDHFDLECSYANVQRAKQQLLEKLRRFERLAQLDPYELDKALSDHDRTDEEEDHDATANRRLVSDLIVEEEKRGDGYCEREAVMKRVFVRLDEWKEAKPESIDMMIELDFRRESNGWWKGKYENNETAMEIQIAILVELIGEFSDEVLTAC